MSIEIRQILSDLGYHPILETGNELRMRPIYRESDNNTSLCILKNTGRWIDYGTGKTGNFNQLIAVTLGIEEVDSSKYLSGFGGFNNQTKNDTLSHYIPKSFSMDYIGSYSEDKSSYWGKRGISNETLSLFQAKLCTKGRMYSRTVFPIFNKKDYLVGFSGRDLTNSDSRPKWKHLGNKSFWIYPYFLNEWDLIEKREVILVESIGDCLSLFEVGIKNVLVTFGIQLSRPLLTKILALDPDKISISLNNDANNNEIGNKAALKIKSNLLNHFDEEQVKIILPKNKDFNEDLLEDKNIIYERFK